MKSVLSTTLMLGLLATACLPTTLQAHHTPTAHWHNPNGEIVYVEGDITSPEAVAHESTEAVAKAIDATPNLPGETIVDTEKPNQNSGK